MKEKPRDGGKIKGAVKVNPRRGQRITRAGVCLPAEPWSSRAERAFCPGCAAHSAPAALPMRSLGALCSEQEEEKKWSSALHGNSEAAG